MNPSHSIQEIIRLHDEVKKTKVTMIQEIWNQFPPQTIQQIHAELSKKIPETKRIPVAQLFNKNIHPSSNQKELINQYITVGVPYEKIHLYFPIIQAVWTKITPLWKSIEQKYTSSLIQNYKHISELEQVNGEIEKVLTTYQYLLEQSENIEKLKESFTSITDEELRQNLNDLYEQTKDIIAVHYQLA